MMNLKKIFDADPASAGKKQKYVLAAVGFGIVAAFFLMSSMATSGKKDEADKEKIGDFKIVNETHAVKSTFMGDVKDDVYGVQKDAKSIHSESEQMRQDMKEMKAAIDRMSGGGNAGVQNQGTPFQNPSNLGNPMGASVGYPAQQRNAGQGANSAGDAFPTGVIAGGPAIGQGNVPPVPPQMPPREVKRYKAMTESDFFGSDVEQKAGADGKKEAPTTKKTQPKNLLSSGTIMKVRLLSGLDAPTLAKAKKAPLPLLMQVSNLGILPNRYKYDVEQCFILGEGYGDLSSERVYVRTTTLSCITKDGKHIDGELSGYISGEDGKNGMRGRVVTKQGAMLARTALAGFLGGVANGFNQQNQTITTSALGSTATQNAGMSSSDIMKMGVFNGMSEATKRLADFYMDLADELTPVIEISANRQADVIVTELKNMNTLEDEDGASGNKKSKVKDGDSEENVGIETQKEKIKANAKGSKI